MDPDYRPGITFVCSIRNSHQKMFCANSADERGQGRNVPAGTVMSGYGGGMPESYHFHLSRWLIFLYHCLKLIHVFMYLFIASCGRYDELNIAIFISVFFFEIRNSIIFLNSVMLALVQSIQLFTTFFTTTTRLSWTTWSTWPTLSRSTPNAAKRGSFYLKNFC